jgi:ABC-type uncharacterized transport system substrate-binding protein
MDGHCRTPTVHSWARTLGCVALLAAIAGCGEKKPAAEPAAAHAIPVVAMIRAADWMGHEWSEDAIKFGLQEMDMEEGRDYQLRISSAQGDLATLPSLIDQARDQKVAVIIALQDPTLEVAVQRVKDIPVVFHLLSDPFAAGAGTTDSNHLANFTGVYAPGFGDPEQERRVDLVKRTLPKARTIGILFSPDESFSVALKDKMTTAAERAGFKVAIQGISNVGDAAQATQALLGQKVDAIEIYGNTAHTAFESILKVAKDKKVPVFSSSPFEVMKGALAAIYPDFQEGGAVAGKMVGRILKGESPANIPFYRLQTSKITVNPNTGVAVPSGVTSEANQVVGDSTRK